MERPEYDLRVHQIYFQDSQKAELFLDAEPVFNEDVSLYFENEIILSLYEEGLIGGDYFGVLSWKVRRKNRIKTKRIAKLVDGRHDLYSFTYDKHDVLGYAEICHPEINRIFKKLFYFLDIDQELHPRVGLYQNAVIARPAIYLDFLENYLIPSVEFLENSQAALQDLLYADARYRGLSKDRLGEMFGFEHYPYHPFVLERLWSVYYEQKRSKTTAMYFFDQFQSQVNQASKVDSRGRLHKIDLA